MSDDISNLGFGVLIGRMSCNQKTIDAINLVKNRKIVEIRHDKENNELHVEVDGGRKIKLFDDGQSCCECRYMVCDDNPKQFVGATLIGFKMKSTEPTTSDGDEEHEIQFLEIDTDRGAFQVANHNEHNGYYGGFHMVARIVEKGEQC